MSSIPSENNNASEYQIDKYTQEILNFCKNTKLSKKGMIERLGNMLEKIREDKSEICQEIKDRLSPAMAEGELSASSIENYCKEEWKRKTKPKIVEEQGNDGRRSQNPLDSTEVNDKKKDAQQENRELGSQIPKKTIEITTRGIEESTKAEESEDNEPRRVGPPPPPTPEESATVDLSPSPRPKSVLVLNPNPLWRATLMQRMNQGAKVYLEHDGETITDVRIKP